MQFDKDGAIVLAIEVAKGEFIREVSAKSLHPTYKVDGLRVAVLNDGKETTGIQFSSANPKIGDQVSLGRDKGIISRIENAGPFIFKEGEKAKAAEPTEPKNSIPTTPDTDTNSTATLLPSVPGTNPEASKTIEKKPHSKEESAEIIEAAVRKSRKKPEGELTKADLEKVGFLDLQGLHLTDVKGLEKLTKLKYLYLKNNPALTKDQIAELQKALPNCKITSNPPLTKEESAKAIEAAIRKAAKKPTGELTKADYEKVKGLSLTGKQLTDVKELEKLTQLEGLGLDRSNLLTDVPKGLEKLPQLKTLSLMTNQLTDVPKGLEKLPQLTFLALSGNQLTDVKGLEKLTQLKGLMLASNKLTDMKGLEKLTKLEVLYLNSNQLTDVKGLEKFTQLTVLSLTGNPDLTKDQIDQLQKALPKCKILHSHKKD